MSGATGRSSSARYTRVAKQEDDDRGSSTSQDELLQYEVVRERESLHPLAFWSFIACLSLCVVNIAMLLQERPENVLDLDALKRPSIYTDLDTLEWDEARLAALPPIVNFPMVMAPVSRSEKKKIWPDDTLAWMTHEGTVSPDERLVFITHDVSMILQFRVIDHKMERCAVVADIPTEAQIRARDRDNNIDLDGDTAVQVYRLDTQRTLKRREISYASKPPRGELVGDFRVSMGALNGTVEFDCKERSLQTFEVVCPAAPCRINFWQNREKPIMAFYLRQTHSLVDHTKEPYQA